MKRTHTYTPFLDDAPELAPKLEVLLERCDGEALVGLLENGKRAAPLEESLTLALLQHIAVVVVSPGGPARYAQHAAMRVMQRLDAFGFFCAKHAD